MDSNFVLLLCIALLLAAYKVDGEAEVSSISISNSNLTDTIVTTNVIDSKNMTDDGRSKTKVGDDGDSSKSSEGNSKGSDHEDEAVSNSSSRKKHGEECDPSNMCTDEEDQFVACLRVPGNDAPHLSLLIQNKGKNALLVTIAAPSFVKLEKNNVQLLENEDTKVKVSIKKGGSNESAIVLSSSKGQCSLELKDLVAAAAHDNDDDEAVAVSRPSILNMRPRTLIMIIMISFLVLSLVIIPMIIHFYKNKSSSQGNKKYQRLDMELPVSTTTGLVTKSEGETGGGGGGGDDGSWNNNWGDDWDDGDEEKPVLPLTPSVSSRGLASRRLGKEGWKD